MIKYLTFILGMTFSLVLNSAELKKTEEKSLTSEIRKLVMNFNKGDIDQLIDKTHPALFKLLGGKEKFIEATEIGIKQLLASGIKFESVTMGKPTKLYKVGDETFCFVPMISVMAIKKFKVKVTSFMVAIRKDNNSEWFYLDGTGFVKQPDLLRKLFPKLPENIKFPPFKREILNTPKK